MDGSRVAQVSAGILSRLVYLSSSPPRAIWAARVGGVRRVSHRLSKQLKLSIYNLDATLPIAN